MIAKVAFFFVFTKYFVPLHSHEKISIPSVFFAFHRRLSREQQIEAARQDSAALKIATVPTMDCLPLFIAAEDSLFQKAGVDVRLKRFGSQTDGDTLLRSKRAEGIVTDLVKAERLRRQGIALNFVTSTGASWQFISNRIARVTELKQLSDKMVAIAPYSATQMLADPRKRSIA